MTSRVSIPIRRPVRQPVLQRADWPTSWGCVVLVWQSIPHAPSSLVAVHQAIESLRKGECNSALAGGVNLILEPAAMIALSEVRALSPDGRC